MIVQIRVLVRFLQARGKWIDCDTIKILAQKEKSHIIC
jgi:hypothetical protein